MAFLKILTSNHLHGFLNLRRSPSLQLLLSSSTLAGGENPADPSAAAGDPKSNGGKAPPPLSVLFAAEKKTKKEKRRFLTTNPSAYRQMEEKDFPETLSPEAVMLIGRLQEGGYLKDANFSPSDVLEPHQIPATLYSRHFLKSAAEKFGQDHQEIAKWLSGSDLKKVALFGCPSVERNTVFASKRLRSFFRIQEDIICRGCKLKSWCKFMNQRVSSSSDKANLSDVMRVITLITLDSVPRQLLVTDDLKVSVAKLLKEVVNLSK